MRFVKKLRRQSQLLEGVLFEGGEAGGRIPAEAGARDRGVAALLQPASGFVPFDRIDCRQVLGADRGKAGQRGAEDGAAHDQAGRGDLAAEWPLPPSRSTDPAPCSHQLKR